MRLSTVFELLVIALLIAFAASRVIDAPDTSRTLEDASRTIVGAHRFAVRKDRQDPQTPASPDVQVNPIPVTQVVSDSEVLAGTSGPSKICSCSSLTCNCCRDFALPVVPIKGPGCATVTYLHDNAMMITMSFGDRVLRNITVNSKKPKPICMGMPGGISKFCGRLYSIKKDGDHFKACLGLELRALGDVEAAVRVSCFRFGPGGVNVEPGEAFPAQKIKEDEEDEDDDDYGLGDFSDDDDDDDDSFGLTGEDDDDDDDDDDEASPQRKDTTYNDVDSSDSDSDYTGFAELSDEIFGGFFGSSKKRPSIAYDDDDDDDDDEDEDYDDEEYTPLKPQAQTQSLPQAPLPSPQVNLVVMHPVIVPAQTIATTKPAIQRRPVKKPLRANSTPSPQQKLKPSTAAASTKATTTAPPKKPKTTLDPVRTLATTTTSPVAPIAEVTTAKTPAKKKKKPIRRRRPTTSKPSSSPVTERSPTVITATTMTVNVVQGEINLNQTKPQKVHTPESETQVKVPMSKPVVEKVPLEVIKQTEPSRVTEPSYSSLAQTEQSDSTTQAILQNTIPTDEFNNEKEQSVLEDYTIKKPLDQQNNELFVEDFVVVGTTPNIDRSAEETTNQDTTVQDFVSYTSSILSNNDKNYNIKATTVMEGEATEKNTETKDEAVVGVESNSGIHTTVIDYTTATDSYDAMSEATDKTETIVSVGGVKKDTIKEEDEDDDDIDIGADLGLDDDDDDDDESNEKNPASSLKPAKKEDDDDDVFGGMLDDEEDEDEEDEDEEDENEKNKKDGEDRALGREETYKINPLLYRLARISSGSVATARHLPRFSEGRNRRNNKRMRFPSLEVIS